MEKNMFDIAADDACKNNNNGYIHFDGPIASKESARMKTIVRNKTVIKKFRFMPFITYEVVSNKYSIVDNKPKVKKKKRTISLASHHDSFVFRYYASLLTQYYDDFSKKNEFSDCAVAYRKKQKKSNITTAKEVFDFMYDNDLVWVFKGDFKGFFDNLDHKYLKKMVANVMQEPRLPDDWYSVIKAITSYRSISKDNLLKAIKRERHGKLYKISSGMTYFKSRRQFSDFVKNKKIKISRKNLVGIPQGTTISAVLANVYMIDFDRSLFNCIKNYGGIYRRYSDDFIVCIPKENLSINEFIALKNKIMNLSQETLKLTIEPTKTKSFLYDRNRGDIRLISGSNITKTSALSYLGFVFDGINVSIRPKSIYKFIYKSKRNVSLLGMSENIWKTIPMLKSDYHGKSRIVKYLIKDQNNHKNFVLRKRIVKRYISIPAKILPRISMMSYAETSQYMMDKGEKYKVGVKKQVVKQIIKNQKKLAEYRKNN
nr:reverse transcriptase/maturase family protein [Lentilactobacillus sp. SPB1-3]MCZ0976321.1 reverse transcriptase/maturase family protein [Lentilactobacillus sp. SPB1-3]